MVYYEESRNAGGVSASLGLEPLGDSGARAVRRFGI